MIGHAKSSCKHQIIHNQIAYGDMYGMWVRVEADAYMMVSEGSYLRRVEIPRGEIFDTFTGEFNTYRCEGDEKEAELSESGMEGDRVEEIDPVENLVDSAEVDQIAKVVEGVKSSPVQVLEKFETSHQPNQILGMINLFQNPIFDNEEVGKEDPDCKVGLNSDTNFVEKASRAFGGGSQQVQTMGHKRKANSEGLVDEGPVFKKVEAAHGFSDVNCLNSLGGKPTSPNLRKLKNRACFCKRSEDMEVEHVHTRDDSSAMAEEASLIKPPPHQ